MYIDNTFNYTVKMDNSVPRPLFTVFERQRLLRLDDEKPFLSNMQSDVNAIFNLKNDFMSPSFVFSCILESLGPLSKDQGSV